MISHGRLRNRKTLPRATAEWICDSRGFSELSQHGRWTFTAESYAKALLRYADDIGQLQWASPMDYMCEPWILAKTGLTIDEHQHRTIESVQRLRELVGGQVHIIPVLQGWTIGDYHRHVAMYAAAGIDLTTEPVVGLGSVCRRQGTQEIDGIVASLEGIGLRLHGFGVKTEGLDAYGPLLASADSFAWSYGARRRIGHCPHGLVKWEANCPERARQWRDRIVDRVGTARRRDRQGDLLAELFAIGGAA